MDLHLPVAVAVAVAVVAVTEAAVTEAAATDAVVGTAAAAEAEAAAVDKAAAAVAADSNLDEAKLRMESLHNCSACFRCMNLRSGTRNLSFYDEMVTSTATLIINTT